MNVALYARHSSDKQNQASCDDQINRCQQWAHEHNYTVTEIYADEALSGSSFILRPAIQKLISEISLGHFDMIICEDLSRLSRDQEDIAGFYKRMAFSNIKIITIAEGEIDHVQVGLKGTMNALYLKDLADKTLRGNIASVSKGRLPGGQKIYGYDQTYTEVGHIPIPGLRHINQKEAEIVCQIFDFFLDGRSLSWIANYLNETAVPSPNSTKNSGKSSIWRINTLAGTKARQAGLLRQTLYKGMVTFNKQSYRIDPDTGKRVSRPNHPDDWIHVPFPELAIVDENIWNAAQDELDQRKNGYKNRHTLIVEKPKRDQRLKSKKVRLKAIEDKKVSLGHLTRAKLYCGKCGQKMKAIKGNYVNCATEYCDHRQVNRSIIIQKIHKNLKIMNEKDFQKFIPKEVEKREHLIARHDKLIQSRKDLRVKIEHTIDSLLGSTIGPETKAAIQRHEIKITRLNGFIEQLEQEILLYQPLSKRETSQFYQRFKFLTDAYLKDPTNHQLSYKLNQAIDRIVINRPQGEPETSLKFSWKRIFEILNS